MRGDERANRRRKSGLPKRRGLFLIAQRADVTDADDVVLQIVTRDEVSEPLIENGRSRRPKCAELREQVLWVCPDEWIEPGDQTHIAWLDQNSNLIRKDS